MDTMRTAGDVEELEDTYVLRTEVYQKLTSKILGSTSLFHEDCITRQKYRISLNTIQITQILSQYLSQACKNQPLSIYSQYTNLPRGDTPFQ